MTQLSEILKKMEKVENIEKGVGDINTKLDGMKLRIETVEEDVVELKNENVVMKKKMQNMVDKMENLENQMRRDNIVFKGIREVEKEKWKDCKETVRRIIVDVMGVQIEENDIIRAHRIKSKAAPRPIVVKMRDCIIKERVLEKRKELKGTVMQISEDYGSRTRKEIRLLVERMKEERKEGKFAEVRFNKLIVVEKDYEYTYMYDWEDEEIKEVERNKAKTTSGKRGLTSPGSDTTQKPYKKIAEERNGSSNGK